MKMKTLISLSLGVTISCMALTTFAAEAIAKEDTTPPPPEGALTASQIPPMSNFNKPATPPTPATPANPNGAAPQQPGNGMMMNPGTAPQATTPTPQQTIAVPPQG